eukprot:4896523-Alexandrium_andersonii.AAC.1
MPPTDPCFKLLSCARQTSSCTNHTIHIKCRPLPVYFSPRAMHSSPKADPKKSPPAPTRLAIVRETIRAPQMLQGIRP